MPVDTTGFTDKASKNEAERALYERDVPYCQAYGEHTDLRVERDGPALAIGGQWETHGPLQLRFLRSRGLRPYHRLLDLGCGTGRFARHAVPYLDVGHYTGLDLSRKALNHCEALAVNEGWAERRPVFRQGDGSLSAVSDRAGDYIWAHSVFTHLPASIIRKVLADVAAREFDVFLFSYKKSDRTWRSGLKQFQYTIEDMAALVRDAGLTVIQDGTKFPSGQYVMGARK